MPFTGFNIKYPEYTVITPQTNLEFNVRTLTVNEEEHLKASLNTPTSISDHLNKCIYESITKKPAIIKSYEDFLHKVTIKDRDALLYGLYHITYEEIRNYNITCSICRNEYLATVKSSDTFNMKVYEKKDILKTKYECKLPVSGVVAILKQPSLFDETRNIKELSSRPGSSIDLITQTMIIDSFVQDIEESKTPLVYSDKVDILDAFLTLPSKDKKVIYDNYITQFGQYCIELKMESSCPKCNNKANIDIDLVDQFFRMAYSASSN